LAAAAGLELDELPPQAAISSTDPASAAGIKNFFNESKAISCLRLCGFRAR
jgi:hypothetical protein